MPVRSAARERCRRTALAMGMGVLLALTPHAAAETHRFTPSVGHATFAVRPPVLSLRPGDVLESESLWGEWYEKAGGQWPGEVGPFALLTYRQAVNWASDIKDYTQRRQMPPWKPTEGPRFRDERKLTDAELATIAAWVDGGTPEGDPKDAPPPRQFTTGWQLGKPDLVLEVPADFQVGASGNDLFRCFVLPTNLPEDRDVVAVEVRPGNPRVVHHALLFIDGTGQGRSYADMALKDASGQLLTIESFAGKRLLINFWASWCIPCREEMPALNALAGKYSSENFMVLPVNTGETDPAKGATFLADGNWPNLPLYAEANSFEIINRLKTTAVSAGLPASVLVDEKGCELAVLQGPAEWDSPDGHKLIEVFVGIES